MILDNKYSIVATADNNGVAIKRFGTKNRTQMYEVCVNITDTEIVVNVYDDNIDDPVAVMKTKILKEQKR